MNKETYEAIRSVRKRDMSVEKEALILRWANKSPMSFITSVFVFYFSVLTGSGFWIYSMNK